MLARSRRGTDVARPVARRLCGRFTTLDEVMADHVDQAVGQDRVAVMVSRHNVAAARNGPAPQCRA
jgi:hypothetical protein